MLQGNPRQRYDTRCKLGKNGHNQRNARNGELGHGARQLAWLVWCWVGFCALFLSPSLGRAADEITFTDSEGKTQRVSGTITTETPKDVTIKAVGKGDVKLEIPSITNIRYDKQSLVTEISAVPAMIEQGRYEEAFETLRESLNGIESDRVFFRSYIMYNMVFTAGKIAITEPTKENIERAMLGAGAFEEKFPRSRHHFPLYEILGQVHLASGKYDKAQEAFGQLKDVDWPGFKEKAQVYAALALLRQKKYGEAIVGFDSVLRAGNDSDEVKTQQFSAKVYKAEAMVGTGDKSKIAEAEKLLRAVLIDETYAENYDVLAAGRLALGDALLAQDRTKESLLDGYMWVVVMYPQNRNQLGRALYQAIQIFTKLKQADRAEQFANRLREELQVPEAEWAKRFGG